MILFYAARSFFPPSSARKLNFITLFPVNHRFILIIFMYKETFRNILAIFYLILQVFFFLLVLLRKRKSFIVCNENLLFCINYLIFFHPCAFFSFHLSSRAGPWRQRKKTKLNIQGKGAKVTWIRNFPCAKTQKFFLVHLQPETKSLPQTPKHVLSHKKYAIPEEEKNSRARFINCMTCREGEQV